MNSDNVFKEYLHSIVSALGGYEKGDNPKAILVKQELNDESNPIIKKDMVYFEGDECLECIKDLRRLLREEEKSIEQPTRLALARWDILSKDLIPILALNPDLSNNSIGRTCFELIVYLLTPLKDSPFCNNLSKLIKEEQDIKEESNKIQNQRDYFKEEEMGSASEDEIDRGYDLISESESEEEEEEGIKVSFEIQLKEHLEHQIRYKKEILKNYWIFQRIFKYVMNIMKKESMNKSDEHFIFTFLTFLKGLLIIHDFNEQLIPILKNEMIIDFLIPLTKAMKLNKFLPLLWSLVDVIYALFKCVDIDDLLLTIKEDSKIDGSVDISTQESLQQQIQNFDKITINELLSQPTRHSKFGGTNLTLDGKKQKLFTVNKDYKNLLNIEVNKPNSIFGKKLHTHVKSVKQECSNIPTGRDLANYKFKDIQQLLGLLELKKGDGHNKKFMLKVDHQAYFKMQHKITREILIHFLLNNIQNITTILYDKCQTKNTNIMDDQSKLIFILNCCLKLIHCSVKMGNIQPLISSIDLLQKDELQHYLINNINQFKEIKLYKSLNISLITLKIWMNLMYDLTRLNNQEDNINQDLIKLSQHHIHNFIYDYAMLKPINDLFTIYYHPSINDQLVKFTFVMNKTVKGFLKNRQDVQVKKKRVKRKIKLDNINKKNKLDDENYVINQQLNNENNDYIQKQVENESLDDESEEDEYDTKFIDYKKYLKAYSNDYFIRVLILYLDKLISDISPANIFFKQTYRYQQINDKLQKVIFLLHSILVEIENDKLIYKASYLHSLNNALIFYTELNACFSNTITFNNHNIIKSAINNVHIKRAMDDNLPKSLNAFKDMFKLIKFIFDNLIQGLNKDPFLFECLHTKSIKNNLKYKNVDQIILNEDNNNEVTLVPEVENNIDNNSTTFNNSANNENTTVSVATNTNKMELDPALLAAIENDLEDPDFFNDLYD